MLPREEEPDLIQFLEQALAGRLAVEKIDHHDDLFELGLDSIDAVEITGDIEARYGIAVDPALLFEERSIANLRTALLVD